MGKTGLNITSASAIAMLSGAAMTAPSAQSDILAGQSLFPDREPLHTLEVDSIRTVLADNGWVTGGAFAFNDVPDGVPPVEVDLIVWAADNPAAGMQHVSYAVRDVSGGGFYTPQQLFHLSLHDCEPCYYSPDVPARVFACDLITQMNPDSTCHVEQVSVSEGLVRPLWFDSVRAWPNPFNARSQVSFELDRAGEMKISAFNILGQEVMRPQVHQLSAGEHTLPLSFFDGLASGNYLVSLELKAGGNPEICSFSLQSVK